MAGSGVHKRFEHDLTPSGEVFFPLIDDSLNLLSLQSIL